MMDKETKSQSCQLHRLRLCRHFRPPFSALVVPFLLHSFSHQSLLKTSATRTGLGQNCRVYLPEKLGVANALWAKPLNGDSGLARLRLHQLHLNSGLLSDPKAKGRLDSHRLRLEIPRRHRRFAFQTGTDVSRGYPPCRRSFLLRSHPSIEKLISWIPVRSSQPRMQHIQSNTRKQMLFRINLLLLLSRDRLHNSITQAASQARSAGLRVRICLVSPIPLLRRNLHPLENGQYKCRPFWTITWLRPLQRRSRLRGWMAWTLWINAMRCRSTRLGWPSLGIPSFTRTLFRMAMASIRTGLRRRGICQRAVL